MKLIQAATIYLKIAEAMRDMSKRRQESKFWRVKLAEIKSQPLVKVAFDTRRIDQETQIIPRRNLQNYNRSEQFITESMKSKVAQLERLKNILTGLKDIYGKQIEWQDSYARILLSSTENALRKNGDFTDNQPGMGSLDYIEELLYARYRLALAEMPVMDDNQIKKAILEKDDNFKNASTNIPQEVKQIVVDGNDTLLEKLFNVKATKENPNIERTITITIKDKLIVE